MQSASIPNLFQKKSINVDIPEDSVQFIPHCARTIGMIAKY